MIVEKTERGFEVISFEDGNGEKCSLQQSSAFRDDDGAGKPGSSLIWLGIDRVQPRQGPPWRDVPIPKDCMSSGRMHLTRDQAIDLIAYLHHWVQTGKFSS